MNKYLKIAHLLCSIFIIIMMTQSVSAQENPLMYKGGADSLIYNTDTVMMENTILDDGSKIPQAKHLSTGLSQFYGKYIKITNLAVGYSITDFFQINFSIPFVIKNMTDDSGYSHRKSCFGDIKLGLALFYNVLSIDSTTQVKATFPTGDQVAQDKGFIMPMGYGGFTFSFLQSFSKSFNSISLRLFLNAGGVYYGKSTSDIDTISKYIIKSCFAFTSLLGIEYEIINGLYIQTKINYIRLPERKYKMEISGSTEAAAWINREDRFSSSDAIFSLHYKFPLEITGTVMGIFPIYEYQDSDNTVRYHRKWKLYAGITKVFTTGTSTEYVAPKPARKGGRLHKN